MAVERQSQLSADLSAVASDGSSTDVSTTSSSKEAEFCALSLKTAGPSTTVQGEGVQVSPAAGITCTRPYLRRSLSGSDISLSSASSDNPSLPSDDEDLRVPSRASLDHVEETETPKATCKDTTLTPMVTDDQVGLSDTERDNSTPMPERSTVQLQLGTDTGINQTINTTSRGSTQSGDDNMVDLSQPWQGPSHLNSPSEVLITTSVHSDDEDDFLHIELVQQGPPLLPSQTSSEQSSQPHTPDEGVGLARSFDKSQVADVSKFELPGLLYAKSSSEKYNRDLLQPADEVGRDVLDSGGGGGTGSSNSSSSTSQQQHSALQGSNQSVVASDMQFQRGLLPVDPGVLLDLEQHAQVVARDLCHVMDNLRNSLHAMTVCTKQSMSLHRESVDNLHTVVDANVKAMYIFMAKFEELSKALAPLQLLASQIQELDENLRVLERSFRTQ